jgi:ComF family protein
LFSRLFRQFILRPAATTLRAALPGQCLLCQAAVAAPDLLCADCHADLPPPQLPACSHCAHPLPSVATAGPSLCGSCQRQPPAYAGIHVAWQYRFPVDHLIQSLKYHRRLPLAALFAAGLEQTIPADFRPDRLIALPLHPHRLRERGFNQAQEIARHLAAARGWRLDSDSLHRLTDNPHQAGHSRKQRLANVRHAFTCRQPLHGETVALLDDVITSGATAHSASRALLAQGAAQVVVLAVARAGKL